MGTRVSSIQWGTNFENVVNFGYPLKNVITDREQRPGSDFVQGTSGVEDAWLTGFDYTLDVDAQWLPFTPNFDASQAPNPQQTPISGPRGIQAFLDWARAKNPFRFVPDYTLPGFYVDGCYLADPMTGGRAVSARLDWTQHFKFRNPSVDFLQALRGVMFEYVPYGADTTLFPSPAPTYSRGLSAYFLGNNGLWQSAAATALRDRHYPLYPTLTRTTWFERSARNEVSWSRDLAQGLWSKTSITAAKDQTGIDGVANSASSLLATAANGTCLQPITLASSARLQSAFVKRLIGSGTIQMTTDGGTTWTTIALTNAWSRASIPIQTVTNPSVGFKIVTSGDKIAVDFVQNETGSPLTTASSPISTAGGGVTRLADSWAAAHVWPPQPLFVYVQAVELGTAKLSGLNGRVLMIGAGDFTAESLLLNVNAANGRYQFMHENGSTNPLSEPAVAPAINDTWEFLGVLNADGSVIGRIALNGGADTVGTQSAASALPSAWAGSAIALGSSADGTSSAGDIGIACVKIGPLTFAGSTVNTNALARGL